MNSSAISASGLRKAYGDKAFPDGTDALSYGVRYFPVTWNKG
ncbi:hypothetical protein OG563_15630 [Nocardia vinacea]|uniref:Uncharacterized protein n=1 Tax=Nocardia vinacea TaxID=96468 RepID=A0ABZ1Z5W8_9NOCA|nr:hypothetical protein [Nocardia vinacea]